MSHRLLIVDDNEDILKMLVRKLRKTGWDVQTANNGQAGMQKALELNPDLILMDMQMPVMDGHEAVRSLRAKGYTGKIAALTAAVMGEENENALQDGCNYFIPKPIDKNFISKLTEILEIDK